jgi:hypothetical protein
MTEVSDSIALYVAWDAGEGADPMDAAWARDLIGKLQALIPGMVGNRLSAEDQPQIVSIEGFENLPSPESFGALSVLLVVTPSRERGFSSEAAERLRALAADAADAAEARVWEGRILALGRTPDRLPAPPPLNALQGINLPDLSEKRVTEVATAALINASLRLSYSSQASLFISYSHRDGWALAEALSDGLGRRGFRVFRDENRDRDDMISIPPGSQTQQVIQANILSHGFLLLLDTPEAEKSQWVREEVSTAFGYLLPLLPVVVEAPPGGMGVRTGGRFRAVRELEREVRLGSEALGHDRTPALEAAVERALSEIATQAIEILLEHLRSRRRLIHGSRQRFEALRYSWKTHEQDRLQFAAERPVRRLTKRIVIQCSPYPRLLRQVAESLNDCFRAAAAETPFNWAVLVHNALASLDDENEVLGGYDYILLLRPHEIAEEALP